HGRVGLPAAAAEERRREPALAEPRSLARDPLAWLAAGRTGVRGAREVRVVAERALRGGRPGPLEPRRLVVLTGRRVGRAHQRRDPDAARWTFLERGECGPDAVVERSFDVARDDCVPFRLGE